MDTAHALEALTPFLPVGARWLPLAAWLVTALWIGGVAIGAGLWVAGAPLRKLRRSGAEVHWTERARIGHPVAVVSAGCGLILPLVLGFAPAASRNALSTVPTAALAVVAIAAIYLPAMLVRRRATRGITELKLGYWEAVRGEWVGYALLTPQVLVMIAMALCIGPAFDALDAVQSALGVAAFAVASRSAGIPLLRLFGAVRRAAPPLTNIVDEVARRSGIRVNRVWVVSWPSVNALALPWSRQLVYTERALAKLDRDEVAAFTAHELGHLSEPASVKLVRSAAGFALLPIGLARPIVARFGLVALLGVVVACYAVLLAVVRVARRMEHRADAVAHAHDPDAGVYARALEKAYRANGSPAVMPDKRPVHPHLYDRLTAAGVVPDYPRPAPPSRKRALAGIAASVVLAVAPIAVMWLVPRHAARFSGDPDRAALWAALAGNAESAAAVGYLHAGDEDPAQAIAWLGLAHALEPHDYAPGAYAAELLAYHGRCDRALALFREVESRAAEWGDDDSEWLQDARDAVSQCEVQTPSDGV
jgi:Zn-dependent protease with chaperone function